MAKEIPPFVSFYYKGVGKSKVTLPPLVNVPLNTLSALYPGQNLNKTPNEVGNMPDEIYKKTCISRTWRKGY